MHRNQCRCGAIINKMKNTLSVKNNKQKKTCGANLKPCHRMTTNKTWPTTPKRRLKIISGLKPARLHRNPTGLRFNAGNMQLPRQNGGAHASRSKKQRCVHQKQSFACPSHRGTVLTSRSHRLGIVSKGNMFLPGIHDSSAKFKSVCLLHCTTTK